VQHGDRLVLAGAEKTAREAAVRRLEARIKDRAVAIQKLAAPGPPPEPRLAEWRRLAAERAAAEQELTELQGSDLAYAANPKAPPPVHVLKRGNLDDPGETVSAAGLSCVPGWSGELGLAPDAPEGDRRLRLADWIADPRNPLTPRVMVNRVWQFHFGRGLVATPSDFGVMGERPTHPELLDWLAATFTGNQKPEARNPEPWSLKRLHRLIVTSNTYKQGVRHSPAAEKVDAENTLLWRMSPRRLEAEEIRDALLSVSGELNPQRGGPGFRPFSVIKDNSHFYTYEDRIGPEYNRRSIYRTVVNSGGVPLLEALDCPDPSVKTPRRSSTTTPIQALSLLNSSFLLRQSRALAERLRKEAGPIPTQQVTRAYALAYGRPPRPPERDRAAAFIARHGLPAYCRVLFNSSEFVYVR
jgi:hypothetical protein